MKNLVIVGGGFGGLQAALQLEKKLHNIKDVRVTLVDKREYHLFAPNLFEVATAEEEFTSVLELKKSIAVPFKEIFKGKNISFLRGEVSSVDPKGNRLAIGHSVLEYDYLVLAAGSVTDYFGIKGAQENSLPLKTLTDALRIRNQVEFLFQSQQMQHAKEIITVMIAGAGYTAVEFAGELFKLMQILCWKYQYPAHKARIVMVEAMSSVIPGLDDRVSRDAVRRLQDFGINVMLNQRIMEVDKSSVYLNRGEKMSFDLLVWTAGVKAPAMDFGGNFELDRKQRVAVNEYLQVRNFPNVFAVGDMASVLDKEKGVPVPPTAQNAEYQAAYLAKALPFFLQNKKPSPYKPHGHGFIVNIGGKWAILKVGKWYMKGRKAYFIDKLAHLNYYRSIMSWPRAIRHTFMESELYGRND